MTTSSNIGKNLGSILRQRIVTILLTLTKLAIISGISPPHLGRIGGGVRFPLASILQKMAKPLGLRESELLSLAGYLSPRSPSSIEGRGINYIGRQFGPYVGRVLSQEPVEVQSTVIGVLNILKSLAKVLK